MSYTAVDIWRSALITTDVQNDFTNAGAPAQVNGTLEILPNLQRLVEGFRRASLPIIHVVRLYLPDGSNADACRRQMIEGGRKFAIPDSDGAELVDVLKPDPAIRMKAGVLLFGSPQQIGPNEWIVYKPRWGAFYNTPLPFLLSARNVNSVVVAGSNYPNCPRATIYQASERDYRVALAVDAVSGIYERGLDEMRSIGVDLFSTDDCLCRLHRES